MVVVVLVVGVITDDDPLRGWFPDKEFRLLPPVPVGEGVVVLIVELQEVGDGDSRLFWVENMAILALTLLMLCSSCRF